MNPDERVAQIREHKTRSHSWMENCFYAQWEQVYRAYLCERDAKRDPNTGKPDTTKTVVGAPDTWSSVNRFVARVTAQAPNLRFACNEPDVAELISRTLMYQWDKAGVQRIQKKHVRQASLFGWSVRPWYWERSVMLRHKRIDIMDPTTRPDELAAVQELYSRELAQLRWQIPALQGMPMEHPAVRAALLAVAGKGDLLPVRYPYVAYQGPKTDFLFVGDCYPEPGFQGIQQSRWFIVERRRNRAWLMAMAKAKPEMAGGIKRLLEQHPKGSQRKFWGNRDTSMLRNRLLLAVNQSESESSFSSDTGEWTITEEHAPGLQPKIALMGEDGVFLGEIESPYDLDGKVPFTELLFIDNLLHGIGDSAPRVMRGVQEMHSNLMSARSDVYDYALRPLATTNDLDLFENPDKIKVHNGFRLAYLPSSSRLDWHDVSSILQAASASFQEEANLARQMQAGTGDSNISMMANVDPQQARTATGAKLLSAQLDTLTRDAIDMFTQTSLRDDAEMMYLLNRSELGDVIEFDSSPYIRGRNNAEEMRWVKVEPMLFQRDGEVTVEAGSTLADDDQALFEKASSILQMFGGHTMIDQRKLAEDVLRSFGKSPAQVREYFKPDEAEPSGPPPVKATMSIRANLAELPPEVQMAAVQSSGIKPPEPPPQDQQVPPAGPPMDPPMDPPMMPQPDQPAAAPPPEVMA